MGSIFRVFGAMALALLGGSGLLLSQDLGPNEREVKTPPPLLSKSDVWTLDFRFKDPRIIKVNVPAKGTRICWYLWYQVINRTEKPQRFSPIFELVTHDYPGVYIDQPLESVVDAIRKIEDPPNYLDIKGSFAISVNPIPVSKPPEEGFPRVVTGVAVWDASPADLRKRDPNQRDLSDTTQFSIFVRGLSNGSVVVDPPAEGLPVQTRFKTLQLKFRRTGDRFSTDSRDIHFLPPAEWTYRASDRTLFPSKLQGVPKAPEVKQNDN